MTLSVPELLTAQHDVAQFCCGKSALDNWLKTRALANQQRGFTVVMVVHEANRVIGYYGLAPTAVSPALMPRSVRTGQSTNPVPCLLLGQLAIDRQWVGKGIGSGLLRHALMRSVAGARLIGGRALVVNAIDTEAARFWSKYGFVESKDNPLILFRAMSDIAASLGKAGIKLTEQVLRG